MEWMIEKELSYSRLVVTVTRLGEDYHVVVQGRLSENSDNLI